MIATGDDTEDDIRKSRKFKNCLQTSTNLNKPVGYLNPILKFGMILMGCILQYIYTKTSDREMLQLLTI